MKTWFFFILVLPLWSSGIGVYFGTFDPPHQGHLQVSLVAQTERSLELVYVIPNLNPEHKPDALSFIDRHRMIKLFIRQKPWLKTLSMEAISEAGKTSDFVDRVLEQIRLQYPEKQIYHICGTDSYLKMKQYGKLPSSASRIVLVVERPGVSGPLHETVPHVEFINNPAGQDLSSTRIREAFKTGTPPAEVLYSPVALYIKKRKLYQSDSSPMP